jgi:HK97 family phage major capsid protein
MTVKMLRQKKADLVAEGKVLLAAAATEDRRLTDAERTRDDEINAELDLINADLIRAERQAERERDTMLQNAEKATTIVMGVDHASERPWGPRLPANASADVQTQVRQAGLGEFAIAVMNATTGMGLDPRLGAAATGMGTAVPSEGGFAVPTELAPGIEREMFTTGELLSTVDVRDISGDNMAYNVIDETSRASTRSGGVIGYWVDQGTAATPSMPKLARVEFKLRKVAALGYMTDELVSDAAALGGELEQQFAEELIFQVEDAITEGTGAGQPFGYLTSPCLVSVDKSSGQTAATITGANITAMWARLSARSRSRSIWLANGDTIPQLAVLTTPVGTGGFAYPYASVSNGAISLWGRPVVFTEYNATLGTVGDIVLIDPKRYRLIKKGSVSQASSIHFLFSTFQTTFRAAYRCDGQMMPRSAATPFKGGSTKTTSPLIVLATRS